MGPDDIDGLGDVEARDDAAAHGADGDDPFARESVRRSELPLSVAGTPGWEAVAAEADGLDAPEDSETALLEQIDPQLLAAHELLAQREAQISDQEARIASLTLECAGLRDQLRERARPAAGSRWGDSDGPSVVAGSLEEIAARSHTDLVARLKSRLDENGQALAAAREQIGLLTRECDRLRQAAPVAVTTAAAQPDDAQGFLGRLLRLFRGTARAPKSGTTDSSPATAAEAMVGAAFAGDPGTEVPTVVVAMPQLPQKRDEPVAARPAAEPRRSRDTRGVRRDPGGRTGEQTTLRRYLIAVDQGRHEVHELTRPRMYVGRGHEADVFLSDATVSRLHAVISYGNGTTIVEDAGSTNGVFVHDRRIRRTILRDGDNVAFGTVAFQYRIGPGPA